MNYLTTVSPEIINSPNAGSEEPKNLRQWSRSETKLNAFPRSTITPKQFIMMLIIVRRSFNIPMESHFLVKYPRGGMYKVLSIIVHILLSYRNQSIDLDINGQVSI